MVAKLHLNIMYTNLLLEPTFQEKNVIDYYDYSGPFCGAGLLLTNPPSGTTVVILKRVITTNNRRVGFP